MKFEFKENTKNQYENIDQVWADLMNGKIVYWCNESYRLTMETANCDYQNRHFTNKNGFVLRVTCTRNWFGSLLDKKELSNLFTNEAY